MDPTATPATVPRALGGLRVALQDAFARASRDLDLTAQQAELLCAAMCPSPVGDLAHVLRCDRSNVSRLVTRARERGWLTREDGETDGRVSMVVLTPEGERLARRFIASLEEQLAPMLRTWPKAREKAAVELITEITDTLDAARDPHARRRPSPHRPANQASTDPPERPRGGMRRNL